MPRYVSASIDNLEATWRSIDDLCSMLPDADWARPTGCPGWTVKDNVSHLIDYEARAVGRPGPAHVPADISHTKNAIGANNEVGVDFRRSLAGADVLAEFREVTSARLAQLATFTESDLEREVTTPAGPGTVAGMLQLRLMDTWTHEQDMRRALGQPGNVDGPAATEAVSFFAAFLPLMVGKRASAPEGSTVLVEVGSVYRAAIQVVDGRAQVIDDAPPEPTVSLAIPTTTFAALVGGRSDPPDDVVIGGDEVLGRAILAQLAFLP